MSKGVLEIHILRAGEQVGPFTEAQVRQYLGQSLIQPSDLAFYEGLESWQPLEQLLAGLPEPEINEEPITEEISTKALPSEPEVPVDLRDEEIQGEDSAFVLPNHFTKPIDDCSAIEGESALPLTETQRTKRKIVIQPILPLEPVAPVKKKSKTGKTAITLEPLRPTTALPPLNSLPPRKKVKGKSPVRTGPVALKNFAQSPVVAPRPALAAPLVQAPGLDPAPAQNAEPVLLKPEIPVLASEPEKHSWYKSISSEVVYAVAGTVALLIGLIFAYFYLLPVYLDKISTTSQATAPSTLTSPPSFHVENPRLQIIPRTAEDYCERGTERQAQGDLDNSLLDFNQALGLDAKNAKAYLHRGLARQAQGDFDGALADYTQVITLVPNQADAYSNRGFVRQAKGNLDGALTDYAVALQLNPKISAAYFNQGLIKAGKGNLDGAISDYDQALALDPKMAVAYYNRGVAKNAEGNTDEALADFNQALALNPKIAHAYCDRGFARQTKGDSEGALTDYAQAVALNPKMESAYFNRAVLEMQKGDLDGAAVDAAHVIDLDPKNGPAYYFRGLAGFGKGDLGNALGDLQNFCDMAPHDEGADSAQLYLWLISKLTTANSKADQHLSAALHNTWNSTPEDLTSKIAAYLVGHMSESALVANTASPDPKREPTQYCRVWYFAGMKRLLNGDNSTAIRYFEKSIATKESRLCEYHFAKAEMQALGLKNEVASKTESTRGE